MCIVADADRRGVFIFQVQVAQLVVNTVCRIEIEELVAILAECGA